MTKLSIVRQVMGLVAPTPPSAGGNGDQQGPGASLAGMMGGGMMTGGRPQEQNTLSPQQFAGGPAL
jgi:hypothetical protein